MRGFEQAQWIWHPDCIGVNQYMNARTAFDGAAGEVYTLRISVDGNYVLYVNGERAAFGQYGDYDDLKFYDELDITQWVQPGENRLDVTAYHPGEDSFTYRKAEPGLIFEVFADGKSICASSEQTQAWKHPGFESGAAVEKVTPQLGRTFHYDSTRQTDAPGTKAVRTAKTDTLMPRPIEKLSEGEPLPMEMISRGSFADTVRDDTPAYRMHTASLTFACPYRRYKLPGKKDVALNAAPGQDGVFAILDSGSEQTGFLKLELEVPTECDVVIGWGEHLEDLRVRSWVGRRNFAAVYRTHPGWNSFENPLLRCGFRYIQVHIYAPQCTIRYVGAAPTWYPQRRIRRFRCADELHNRIYDTAVRTLRLCMHEHYEDCPWREQSQYTMDSRNQMLCGYYAFSDLNFPKAALRLMGHSIRPDNFLCICSPAGSTSMIPSFSAIYLTQLWEYLQFSGDAQFVREMLPTARRILNEFTRRINKEGVLSGITDEQAWNFYEWAEGLQGRQNGKYPRYHEQDAVLCGFVLLALRSMMQLSNQLGNTAETTQYTQQYRQLCDNVHRVFFDPEQGVYASYVDGGQRSHYCELTNALLLCADAAPERYRSGIRARLADGSLIPVTLSHSIFKYEALLTEPETYGRYVFTDVAKVWGAMLTRGATAFWETAEGAEAFDNAGSLCHGWSAVPVYLYMKYAVHMDPAVTGLYECRIEDMNDGYGR